MKILYGVQGTGNGHLSRAMEILPAIQKRAEVDVLLSGTQSDLKLPFPVKYRFQGLSFVFGKDGGVDLWRTFRSLKLVNLISEIRKLPVEDYDLVITDFEPVSAWAARFKGIPCAALSNQAAIFCPAAPKPEKTDFIGKFILKYYVPSSSQYGFHFQKFDDHTYTPVIRKQVREMPVSDAGHYTVYLPAHEDELVSKILGQVSEAQWEVFSKRRKEEVQVQNNVKLQPIDNEKFLKSMVSSRGVLCAAGFGTTSEALFLGKKLLAIPMKRQYEQDCNAAVLESMGVTVLHELSDGSVPQLKDWVAHGKPVRVDYPDQTDEIIERILEDFTAGRA